MRLIVGFVSATSLTEKDCGKENAMRGIQLLSICVLLAGMVGCNPKVDSKVAEERLLSYRRLAIVCVPGKGADPNYVDVIITHAKKKAPSRLGFLSTVDFPKNISVDGEAVPPTLNLSQDVSAYDAIAVLVYSYSGSFVYLDIYMIDTKSGESIWHHQLATRDWRIHSRLLAHGHWTPSTIKIFYGKN